ncbi:reverse transcriptase domain-containing protein [Tanacetum coccineum]|uniref:Reverse transcriptase domain-containing protein n=1 Tax=Tanacetum coccineum TaxID=301880 RepID=A0ABQ5GUD2_9ASTR
MTTLVEKQNTNKFYEFHGEVGHNTDECNHLRKQIKDMLKAGKLSHIIRELKQSSGKDQSKKEGETSGKEKPQTILMIQSRQKVIRQKITQSFSPNPKILFPSLRDDEGAEGPLIIEAEIEGHQVHRICIDGGSSFEILYEHCFNRLRPEIKNQIVPATTSLIGFSGEIKWPLGQITLLVKIRDDEHSTSAWMDFIVVRSTSPHNGIIGRPRVEVTSTKFGHIRLDPSGYVGCSKDIIAEHRLNVREGCQPVRQKKRGQAAERNIAINDEVSKLVAAGIMREVHYHDWLSNPVMVKKSDNSWRMCVDFKDLNKACPKDGYPLPEIDWKVESLCGFPFKCFLDAYKGYHQIQMAEEDEEKTAFITNQGIFCYTKMPFGLRNAGATYQRLVDKTFHGQIGRNLEVYVDDLVIKSRTEDEIVRDIEETFKTLRKINMKLNPKKCTFGVEEGMFLGYQVNTKGIKICPDKVDAVLSLQSPKCLKDVHKLNGKLASLNRPVEWRAAFRQMIGTHSKCYHAHRSKEQEDSSFPGSIQGSVSANYDERSDRQTVKTVKGQVLADFIVERPEEEGQGDLAKEEEPLPAKFGLPGEIISDNGKQFRDNPFKDWCEKLCIQPHFASVKHPQTNGLAHRTMVKSSNGDTPFSLTYRMEAVIPAEIRMPTFKTAEVDVAKNDEALKINLELIEEKREQAAITEAKSKR